MPDPTRLPFAIADRLSAITPVPVEVRRGVVGLAWPDYGFSGVNGLGDWEMWADAPEDAIVRAVRVTLERLQSEIQSLTQEAWPAADLQAYILLDDGMLQWGYGVAGDTSFHLKPLVLADYGVEYISGTRSGWVAVRCVFREPTIPAYEERVTVWKVPTMDEGIRLAKEEAAEYAETVNMEFLDFSQAYLLGDNPRMSGAEVFSLIRDSELAPDDYVDRYFSTGTEHEQHWKAPAAD